MNFSISRKDKVKIMNSLPASIKETIIENKININTNPNLIPGRSSFSRNNGINWRITSFISKYADIENFDQKAKNAFDNFFKEFNFKKN